MKQRDMLRNSALFVGNTSLAPLSFIDFMKNSTLKSRLAIGISAKRLMSQD
jgi:hypothetical protein